LRPRLFVIAGPAKDRTFPLPEGESTLGRDPGSAVALNDPSVSRKHCLLRRAEDGRVQIKDLESRNGTLVNGLPITEQWLHHGDEIAPGDSVLVFLVEEEENRAPASRVEFDDSHPAAETKLIHPREVVYLQPDRLLEELSGNSQLARNLGALLKISRVVHSIRDLEQLQAQLMELIFEVVPANRGAILLSDGATQEFGSGPGSGQDFHHQYARARQPGQPPLRVSRTVARQAMHDNVAILGVDVTAAGPLRDVESLVASEVRSLICVPLSLFQRTIGCIYLDSTNPAKRFHEDHLQLMAAIAGISAVALDNARRLLWLEQENQRLTTEVRMEQSLVGDGPRMNEIFQFLSRVGPTDSTVLIEGESGTGKELVAKALHRLSARSTNPFVAINCAAIQETLLESELFGHERGAFTGAVTRKKGRMEVADSGVLFLDEIGDMSPALQAKLLRALQERQFERVGGTSPIKIDIRLIAATNRNLLEAVKEGKFRPDLYYRLAVVTLTMPPLRERREDIPMLTHNFIKKYAERCQVKPKPVSPEALAALQQYDWPGNVRELENALERALVMGASDTVLPEDLPEALMEQAELAATDGGKYHPGIKQFKRNLILDAVVAAKGSYVDAAKTLGMHVNYLHRVIKNLDLKDDINKALRGKK